MDQSGDSATMAAKRPSSHDDTLEEERVPFLQAEREQVCHPTTKFGMEGGGGGRDGGGGGGGGGGGSEQGEEETIPLLEPSRPDTSSSSPSGFSNGRKTTASHPSAMSSSGEERIPFAKSPPGKSRAEEDPKERMRYLPRQRTLTAASTSGGVAETTTTSFSGIMQSPQTGLLSSHISPRPSLAQRLSCPNPGERPWAGGLSGQDLLPTHDLLSSTIRTSASTSGAFQLPRQLSGERVDLAESPPRGLVVNKRRKDSSHKGPGVDRSYSADDCLEAKNEASDSGNKTSPGESFRARADSQPDMPTGRKLSRKSIHQVEDPSQRATTQTATQPKLTHSAGGLGAADISHSLAQYFQHVLDDILYENDLPDDPESLLCQGAASSSSSFAAEGRLLRPLSVPQHPHPLLPSPRRRRGESYLYTDPQVAARLLSGPAGEKKSTEVLEKWYSTVGELMAFSQKTVWTMFRPRRVFRPWSINHNHENLSKYRFFGRHSREASARLRYKARTMIGATGSRHLGQRRRASLASSSLGLSPTMLSHLESVSETSETRSRPATRRRVVDTSDLRTCAILQTRLKEIKTPYPE
ncbi:hypothetical protein ACOMHN_007360 [Nucella lapillus]